MLGRQFPKVEAMLRDAADDITAFADFPAAHWKKIWSTNLWVPDTRLRSCGAFVFVDESAEAVVSDDVEVAAGRFLQGA